MTGTDKHPQDPAAAAEPDAPLAETGAADRHAPAGPDAGKPAAKRNPAKVIALGVIVLLVVLVVWYALSDRMAPSSSRGVVSAHVVQIAPQIGRAHV